MAKINEITEEQIAKLPVWARREFTSMRQKITWLTEQVEVMQVGPTDTNTIADPYFVGEGAQRLPLNTRVRFLPVPGDPYTYLDVQVTKGEEYPDGRIELHGSHVMVFRPRAGNSATLNVGREWQ